MNNSDNTYNGFTNRNTWLLSLYVYNDYDIQKELYKRCERIIYRNSDIYDANDIQDMLFQSIKEYYVFAHSFFMDNNKYYRTDRIDDSYINYNELAEIDAKDMMSEYYKGVAQ